MKQTDGSSLILRSIVVLLVINFQTSRIFVSGETKFIIKGEEDKAMDGKFILKILNLIGKPLDHCLKHCLENCRCRSFQICHMTKCQLCSSDQYTKNTSLQSRKGCTYFDITRQPEPNNQQCSDSCSTSINCCLTSNPCLNGGTCLPRNPTTRRPSRFTCKCPAGFTGIRCQKPIKSCRGYNDGTRAPGIYKVFDQDMAFFDVYCYFESNTSMTWTLIQSYERNKKVKTLAVDQPLHQDSHSWKDYRLSRPRMRSSQNDSTKWRVTCQFEKGLPLSDYVFGTNKNMDILTNKDGCFRVNQMKIRDYSCNNCTAYFSQTNNTILHYDNGERSKCGFNPPAYKNCGGEYFGHYKCMDEDHKCSGNPKATTQTWFGGQ